MHDAVESAPADVASVLRRVIVEEPLVGDPDLGDPVDSVVSVLLREAARRALADVEAESRVDGSESWQSTVAETAQVRRWLDALGDEGGRDAADRLVAWLSERESEG